MNLAQRLELLEKQKPIDTIKLGLDRVKSIALSLGILKFSAKVIMVAGTNGKGSTIATLEQLLLSHEQQVATYTSPHLFQFNERIRLNGCMVQDSQILDAFDKLEQQAGAYELTYYEWVTLSALLIFSTEPLDYILLEVGLGGRLDAVNIVDADIALITSIDFDHTDLLGETLEEIAFEKAGIFRNGQKVFCAEPKPPKSLLEQAQKNQVALSQLTVDFDYKIHTQYWTFIKGNIEIKHLPLMPLHLNNVSNALSCFVSLNINYTQVSIQKSLKQVTLFGRCQQTEGDYPLLLDVAHNQQSMTYLSSVISKLNQPIDVVFSMLKGKEIERCITLLAPYVHKWFVAPLSSPRAYSLSELENIMIGMNYQIFPTIKAAFSEAKQAQKRQQTLVVCGSFLTVCEAMS